MLLEHEAKILQKYQDDFDQAFIELGQLVIVQVYWVALLCTSLQPALAERLTRFALTKAYQELHTLRHKQESFRTVVLAWVMRELKRSGLTQHTTPRLTKAVRKHWTEAEQKYWIQFMLTQGEERAYIVLTNTINLSVSDVARCLGTDVGALHIRYHRWSGQVQERLREIFQNMQGHYTLAKGKQRRLLRLAMTQPAHHLSFVRTHWWQRLLQPVPLGFFIICTLTVLALVYVTQTPQPWAWLNTPEAALVNDVSNQNWLPVRKAETTGRLPAIPEAKQDLVVYGKNVYGTYYPQTTTNTTTTEAALTPTIKLDLASDDYTSLEQAYAYAVPQTLTEADLQAAVFRHFASLPLNQFTFVNGTYYITEAANEFRPLFVAFNSDGTIEYQMRQAAICQLPNLTTPVTDQAAQQLALDFLKAHDFISVPTADLQIVQLSSPERTINKGAVCNSDDSYLVSDHEFIIYPPHTLLRYGALPGQLMPLRVRGIRVQVHADTVTHIQIDPLQTLQDSIVKTNEATIRPLSEAISDVQAFTYPATDQQAEAARYTKVFMQWDHLQGDDRLTELTLTDVKLEYVYDTLNHVIEPYYVFSGAGKDANGKDDVVRVYVVATTAAVELRGPYRE